MSVFDHAVQKAETWIAEVMRELGTKDPKVAYHALSAGLQALRDRLRVEEAAQLGAQLPLLIRGLFYEGWHPASTPVHVRQPQEFMALFERKAGDGERIDPERGLAALFAVLERHVSRGELESIAHVLPRNIAELAK
jgi:uncharacterized protein (DUF2267 family)